MFDDLNKSINHVFNDKIDYLVERKNQKYPKMASSL